MPNTLASSSVFTAAKVAPFNSIRGTDKVCPLGQTLEVENIWAKSWVGLEMVGEEQSPRSLLSNGNRTYVAIDHASWPPSLNVCNSRDEVGGGGLYSPPGSFLPNRYLGIVWAEMRGMSLIHSLNSFSISGGRGSSQSSLFCFC